MSNHMSFILGAHDDEMSVIENVLRGLKLPYAYATANNERCTSRNAYAATGVIQMGHGYQSTSPIAMVVTIECAGPTIIPTVRIDHHHPGDTGFDKGADQYFDGSSIGQLCNLLMDEGYDQSVLEWHANVSLHLAAANDHCPAHALAGLCPGVDPEQLRNYRINAIKRVTALPEAKIRIGIQKAAERLKALPRRLVEGVEVIHCTDSFPHFVNAVLWSGSAVEYYKELPDGSVRKGLLSCTSPAVVQTWMNEHASVLKDIYGCPVRGYAGGYLP